MPSINRFYLPLTVIRSIADIAAAFEEDGLKSPLNEEWKYRTELMLNAVRIRVTGSRNEGLQRGAELMLSSKMQFTALQVFSTIISLILEFII